MLRPFVTSSKKKHFFALVIFICSACYITFPMSIHMGSLATNLRDELLISWIQSRVIYNFFHHPLHLFGSNIFYPYANTLAYSDLHLISAFFSAIPVFITGQPITALNFTLISSLILLGFGGFLMSYKIGNKFGFALLAGLMIQFSPATLDKNVHVQVLASQWMLLSAYFFILFLKKRKLRYYILAILFFVVQTVNSFLPGFFTLVVCSSVLLFYCRDKGVYVTSVVRRKHVLFFLIGLIIISRVALPYIQVSKQFSYVRDIRETVHLSLQPEDLYFPNDLTRLQPILLYLSHQRSYSKNAEFKVGYLGFVLSALSILSLFFVFVKRLKVRWEFAGVFYAGITGLILSFGPVLHLGRMTIHHPFLIPLPNALFYYLIPGFQGIRAVYRWEILFIICSAISSSLLLGQLTKRMTSIRKNLICIGLIILTIAEFHSPMHFVSVPQVRSFPRVYTYLKALPESSVVVEMPIYNWNVFPYSTLELRRVYFSTYHQQILVNGASGFSPPPWQKEARYLLADFPGPHAMGDLKKFGVKYIIVHKAEYDTMSRDRFSLEGRAVQSGDAIVARLSRLKNVVLLKSFGNDLIYHFR